MMSPTVHQASFIIQSSKNVRVAHTLAVLVKTVPHPAPGVPQGIPFMSPARRAFKRLPKSTVLLGPYEIPSSQLAGSAQNLAQLAAMLTLARPVSKGFTWLATNAT